MQPGPATSPKHRERINAKNREFEIVTGEHQNSLDLGNLEFAQGQESGLSVGRMWAQNTKWVPPNSQPRLRWYLVVHSEANQGK